MRIDKQKANWLLDVALFGGFLLAMWLDLTGVAFHQWWGLGVAVLAAVHALRHQKWVVAVTKRLQHGASGLTLSKAAVDVGLLVGFAGIAVTGLGISTWLDLSFVAYDAWRAVHVAFSVATAALIVLKIGMHWRWLGSVARRRLVQESQPALSAGALTPGTARVGRREFVRVMGLVGASTLLVGVNALRADDTGGDETALTGASAAADTGIAVASTKSSACTVRCGRRCSHPGHCRRYADTNGNGKCDEGECSS